MDAAKWVEMNGKVADLEKRLADEVAVSKSWKEKFDAADVTGRDLQKTCEKQVTLIKGLEVGKTEAVAKAEKLTADLKKAIGTIRSWRHASNCHESFIAHALKHLEPKLEEDDKVKFSRWLDNLSIKEPCLTPPAVIIPNKPMVANAVVVEDEDARALREKAVLVAAVKIEGGRKPSA